MAKKHKEEEPEEEEDESIYGEEGREDLVEDGEISAEEEAFMRGYDEASDEEKEAMELDEDEDI